MAVPHSSDTLRGASILIVDDQEANIALLEALLAEEGYTNVYSTTDPRAALAHFRSRPVDLVLLDLHMPHLDGFAVMRELATCVPADAYLPILVLTADISAPIKRRALTEGAKDFLSKPFDVGEVLEALANLWR